MLTIIMYLVTIHAILTQTAKNPWKNVIYVSRAVKITRVCVQTNEKKNSHKNSLERAIPYNAHIDNNQYETAERRYTTAPAHERDKKAPPPRIPR